ncbi:MAG: protein TolQ [Alphaproteobacteria bacterium CG_4_10_14_0_2_um_filter_63_37]|nr:MAG: protein TolQ [Proteobacteria bacterium CG1_02_64_396]PJA23511.1 MAG: protein TolQ [Alphaproteobacteria bacterium CG_4_10_14_0_2_um_filter_63_37]
MNEITASDVNVSLNPLALVLDAGFVVQGVLLLLVLASLLSLVLMFAKGRQMRKIRAADEQFLRVYRNSGSLAELFRHWEAEHGKSPCAALFGSAYKEWNYLAQRGGQRDNTLLAHLVHRVMARKATEMLEELEERMSWLASVASTAPFVGLFGTVWGIMNAFIGLTGVQTTTIAMVAPGIAEALVATAFGLFAAIPAVVGFNLLSARIKQTAAQMEVFADDFLGLVEKRGLVARGEGDQTLSAGA